MDTSWKLALLDRMMAHHEAGNTTDLAPEMYRNRIDKNVGPLRGRDRRLVLWFAGGGLHDGRRDRVGLGNSVAPGHAAFLYSLMRPSQRAVRSTESVVGGVRGCSVAGVGGRCSRERWGRWVL